MCVCVCVCGLEALHGHHVRPTATTHVGEGGGIHSSRHHHHGRLLLVYKLLLLKGGAHAVGRTVVGRLCCCWNPMLLWRVEGCHLRKCWMLVGDSAPLRWRPVSGSEGIGGETLLLLLVLLVCGRRLFVDIAA